MEHGQRTFYMLQCNNEIAFEIVTFIVAEVELD